MQVYVSYLHDYVWLLINFSKFSLWTERPQLTIPISRHDLVTFIIAQAAQGSVRYVPIYVMRSLCVVSGNLYGP